MTSSVPKALSTMFSIIIQLLSATFRRLSLNPCFALWPERKVLAAFPSPSGFVKISRTNDPLSQSQQEIDQSVDGNGVQVGTRVFHPYSMESIWRTDRSVLQIGKNCIAIGNCF